MATEFKLSYTANDINNRLGKIDILAEKSEIPKKVSDLTNDSGFVNESYVSSAVENVRAEALNNDVVILTEAQKRIDAVSALVGDTAVSIQIENALATIPTHDVPTDEEMLELLMDMDVVQPFSNTNDAMYIDNNNKLYVL